MAASNNRPSEADLIAIRNAVAQWLRAVGQLPQTVRSIVICVEQCQSALGRLQSAIDIRHFLPTFPMGRMSGHIVLHDYNGDKSLTPVRIDLIHNGSPMRREMVFLGADGSYALENVYAGTYTVSFSAHQCLNKNAAITVSSGSTSTCDVSLVNGDADGDNHITSTDLSILLKNLGQ
jgi:hypothetical protein